MLWVGKSSDDRRPISGAELQAAITEAVKQSGPDCEAFIDVIVGRVKPESRIDPNWDIKGVRFGGCDRGKAGQVIAVIVERMQREFRLEDNPVKSR